ncbi:hypothetical protein RF55_20359 [Lasius niger]|uniref:Uncharacterized protein n=1 Tax=Lasius niger TaxID=67767 RepID=A0A0J7JYN9_LASNI|nr:hypothetical protein RF55_20359 [Lasius niger]
MRRTNKNFGGDVMFTVDMVTIINQTKFLSNDKNKRRLIEYLSKHLQTAGVAVKQADHDADRLIVTTAIAESIQHDKVVTVGEDIDLAVLMIGLTHADRNIHFFKQGRGKTDIRVFYDPEASRQSIGDAGKRLMLALYGVPIEDTHLDNYRFKRFQTSVARAKLEGLVGRHVAVDDSAYNDPKSVCLVKECLVRIE